MFTDVGGWDELGAPTCAEAKSAQMKISDEQEWAPLSIGMELQREEMTTT